MFLYIDPLKQGLKPIRYRNMDFTALMFLYIDPLKQGLKLMMNLLGIIIGLYYLEINFFM